MTCFQAGSTSMAARGANRPCAATGQERVHARPSAGHASRRLGDPLAGDHEDLSRRSSGHGLQALAGGPQPIRDERRVRTAGSLEFDEPRLERRDQRRGPAARWRPRWSRRSRSPSPRPRGRVGSYRASRSRPGSPRPRQSAGAPVASPATASTSAAAATSGRWLMAGDRGVVGAGRHPDADAHPSPGRASLRAPRPRRRRWARRPTVGPEEVGVRGVEAARLAARHRVAADEPEPERGRPQDERGLRARDVGDHGSPGQARAPRAGEVVEQARGSRARVRRGRRDRPRRVLPRAWRRPDRDARPRAPAAGPAPAGRPGDERPGVGPVAAAVRDAIARARSIHR